MPSGSRPGKRETVQKWNEQGCDLCAPRPGSKRVLLLLAVACAIIVLARSRCESQDQSPPTGPSSTICEPAPLARAESPAADSSPSAAPSITRPAILSRTEWKAAAALPGMRPHRPTLLTVHHSGVAVADDEDLVAAMRGLQRYSQLTKHWPDVPYHFVIGRRGHIAEGRSAAFAGDTNTEYDPAGHLLVCVEGNFEEQVPTAEQVASLKALCAWLCQEHRISPRQIHGHNHYATTACPGRNLSPLLPTLVPVPR